MNDEQLRDRLGRVDPAIGDASITPVTSPEARSLLEDIMSTPVIEQTPEHTAPAPGPRRQRRPLLALATAAAVTVGLVAVGITVLGGGDDSPDQVATVLELEAPASDPMAMCMVLEPAILAENPIAFKGTVTSAEGGVVTLTIDEAYRGVDADVATLQAAEGMEALIGGIDWQVGEQYLVSAYEGVVNYCGQTGPATPELQAMYDAAYGA